MLLRPLSLSSCRLPIAGAYGRGQHRPVLSSNEEAWWGGYSQGDLTIPHVL